jgi:serine/threonine protein kinase
LENTNYAISLDERTSFADMNLLLLLAKPMRYLCESYIFSCLSMASDSKRGVGEQEQSMSTSPRRIGQYELMQQIGSGHVGEVWKARDLAQKRDIAVKLFYNDLQADPHFLNRLKNGGRVLTSLRHTNLVSVYDVVVSRPEGSRETTALIAMDYIEGHTLTEYLKATAHRGIFPSIQDLIYLFSSLSDALDTIHQQNIVHGNIKPNNILLNKQLRARITAGEPQLTDVGITQIAGGDSHLNTPQYLAPEQAQGQPANPASDIYALGILLYEICTGAVPFRGESSFAIISQQINTLPTPPMLINVNIPTTLSEVILRALAKNPNDRYATATQFANAIAEACSLPASNPSTKHLAIGHEQSPPNIDSSPQTILGISQPISNDQALFMRSSRPQNTSPHAPIKLVSLNGNASVSAALVFPNSSPLPAIKNPATASVPSPQADVNSGPLFPQQPSPQVTNPNNNSGPLSLPPTNTHQQFLTKQLLPSMDQLITSSQPSLFQTTPPPIQGSYSATPYETKSLNQESASSYLQQSTMPHMAAQPSYAGATPYQSSTAPSQQEAIPFTHKPTSSQASNNKNKYMLPFIFALVIVIILAAIGIPTLLSHNNNVASTPSKVNHITAIVPPTNAVFFQDDALGHNDQLHITLTNIPAPPAGEAYHVWLQTTKQVYISLADLPINNNQADYMYGGDQNHSNLLSYLQGIIITTETPNSSPQAPSNHIIYQATFSATLLPKLKNILYATPGLGAQEAAPVSLLNAIKSMDDKAASIVDSLTRDYGLVQRQSTRIIETIDGTKYARSSGDLPAKLASQLNAPIGLLSSAKQTGYIDILNNQLDDLSKVAGNNQELIQRIQYAKNGLADLKSWIQKIRTYDIQLLKAAKFNSPTLTDAALRLRQTMADSYTGHTIPPATSPSTSLGSAGMQQVYIETQYLATLTLIPSR